MMRYKYFYILLLVFLFYGCNEEQARTPVPKADKETAEVVNKPGCTNCHSGLTLDNNHAFSCTDCHRGNNEVAEKTEAHKDLVAEPASPAHMAAMCGRCHPEQVRSCGSSLHFTLKNAVNLTRKHFGARTTLQSLTEIPQTEDNAELALVDDMLRRRCLRCHVYSSGDDYPYITRGKGCAACHLQFSGGTMQSHAFIKTPGDARCISCHYANHVGADYYGQFEHDFNWEYRTPYTTSEPFFRPYGVEVHDLATDIHQQKGLVCIDCHSGNSLKNNARKITCITCHGWRPGTPRPKENNLTIVEDSLVLTDTSGKTHVIAPMRHPAHAKYGKEVACQVCHGQWSFNDASTYLLRSETDDYDAMERLTVQSSSWVETLLEHNLNSDEEETDPVMPDGITGRIKGGLWYLGYGQRRWEQMIIKRDSDGIIKVFRPILDLHLSAVDENETVLFDDLTGNGSGLLPYTPHTTGPAGLFYLNRFQQLLNNSAPEPKAQ